jgi:hypothetical protein
LRHCAYHCRGCDSCFTSLAAFDAHRTGPFDDRLCDLAEADLDEHRGVCRISDADEETGQPIPRMRTINGLRVSEAEKERLKGLTLGGPTAPREPTPRMAETPSAAA